MSCSTFISFAIAETVDAGTRCFACKPRKKRAMFSVHLSWADPRSDSLSCCTGWTSLSMSDPFYFKTLLQMTLMVSYKTFYVSTFFVTKLPRTLQLHRYVTIKRPLSPLMVNSGQVDNRFPHSGNPQGKTVRLMFLWVLQCFT